MSKDDKKPNWELGVGVKERAKAKTKKPRMYKVLLHNDDYTTMEFVVHVLTEIFRHNRTMATQIMLHVHTKGVGVCGTFTHDIAETKVAKVHASAESAGMPLKCTMEPQ
jgi:ATP-dependent Clp protease adaptor protein ClpS